MGFAEGAVGLVGDCVWVVDLGTLRGACGGDWCEACGLVWVSGVLERCSH